MGKSIEIELNFKFDHYDVRTYKRRCKLALLPLPETDPSYFREAQNESFTWKVWTDFARRDPEKKKKKKKNNCGGPWGPNT